MMSNSNVIEADAPSEITDPAVAVGGEKNNSAVYLEVVLLVVITLVMCVYNLVRVFKELMTSADATLKETREKCIMSDVTAAANSVPYRILDLPFTDKTKQVRVYDNDVLPSDGKCKRMVWGRRSANRLVVSTPHRLSPLIWVYPSRTCLLPKVDPVQV